MTDATNYFLSKEQLKPYLQETNQKSDKLIGYFLWAYFGFGIFLAPFHDTWLAALGAGSIWLLAYWGPKILLPRLGMHHYVVSVVLGAFMAQFIYQMHGLFEMHFTAPLAAVVLIVYQNWKLQIPLLLTIIIHHSVLAHLHNSGLSEVHFTQLSHMDLPTFLFHIGLVGAISGVCGLWAYHLRKSTISNIIHSLQFNDKKHTVATNIKFAEEISKGNLNPDFSLNESDSLSKALLDMRQSLLIASEREQQEKFKTVGLAEMGDILRANQDLAELSSQLIVKLVKYMKANQGGLFILNDDNNDKHLELAACYAYERKKYQQKIIQIGEGLVGQSVLEKDTLYITDVPDDYINIRSGLGKANPTSILIVPLMVNEKIEGVIELASFNPFQPYEIDFVKKLGESIASTISSVRTNERTRRLLEDTQQQAEEMRAQEEEMRQNLEELAATQEEIHRKSAEMERIAAESQEQARRVASNEKRITTVLNNVTAAIIQTGTDGTIQSINSLGEHMFGYNTGELTDKDIETLLPGVKTNNHTEGMRTQENAHRKDGSAFVAAANFKRIAAEGETFLMYFVWDIEADIQREKEMQEKQREIEELLEEARQGEEMMKAQEEVLRQNLEEMVAVQDSLKEKAADVEKVREEEKARADALIESQQKTMEKLIVKNKEKEDELQTQIDQLRRELEQLRK